MTYAELEVSFHQRDERKYAVEFRYDAPDNQARVPLGPFNVEFDWDCLDSLIPDAHRYGEALSAMFFKDSRVRESFTTALAASFDYDALRIRLYLNRDAPLLHSVLWETLQDPTSPDGIPLATNERVLLSRFLSSWDFRPVHLRPRGALCALVAIASPAGLESQRVGDRILSSVDAEGEWSRLSSCLGQIGKEKLSQNGRASLNQIATRLREGFDIFVLVCHGALVDGEPLLWLEDEAGRVARVMGIDLVFRLKDMKDPPRLIVLCSCQSAGHAEQARSNDKGALAALGPRLAEAGIPAIIAMQDNVRMDTAASFLTVFFRELMEDSQIDRAMAVARSAVHRDYDDWWVPVLITRLKRGRVWFEQDSTSGDSFRRWNGLMRDILQCDCTPILGPDLVTPVLGSPVETARRWAERYDFPMSPQDRDSLPQVAQYLAYHETRDFMLSELGSHICQFLLRTYPNYAEEIRAGSGNADPDLNTLITHVGKRLRENNERDVFHMLAELPFPIYINTSRDNLLRDALQEAGKQPRVEICRWTVFEQEQSGWPQSVFVAEPGYRPTVEEPLVFHLFGNLLYPETLVIAEDDYFNFLIGINKNWRTTYASTTYGSRERDTGTEPFPQAIIHAFSQGGLLFLGFRTSDWEFRTLFRSLVAQESWLFNKRNVRVSVQMQPDENNFLEPQGARKYIEDYFDKQPEVYWGPVEEFVSKILDKWTQANRPTPFKKNLTGRGA